MRIFVINLDRRQDRWLEISEHLRSLGLEFSRVAAIDGLIREPDGRALIPPSADACWQSHQKVYALITQRPREENFLILEDDAVLDSRIDWTAFLNTLDRYMVRESIDVLQVGFLQPAGFEAVIRAVGTKVLDLVFRREDARAGDWFGAAGGLGVIPHTFAAGSHCYAISGRAAAAVLGLNTPTFAVTDEFFSCIAEHQRRYRCFRIGRMKTSLAAQRSRGQGHVVDSDIDPSA